MKKKKQKIESVFIALFGGVLVIESMNLLDKDDLVLSAGLFPMLVGLLIFILSVVLFFKSDMGEDAVVTRKIDKISFARCFLMMVICLLYVLLMKSITFFPATILFIAAATVITGERKWWRVLFLSIIGSAVIFVAFKFGLNVYLP